MPLRPGSRLKPNKKFKVIGEALEKCSLETLNDSTFCGRPVICQAKGRTKKCTLGGLLKRGYLSGEIQLCGLLSSGSVLRLLEDSFFDRFKRDVKIEGDKTGESANRDSDRDPWDFANPQDIGHLLTHDDDKRISDHPEKRNYSWALIEMVQVFPNRLPAVLPADHRHAEDPFITDFFEPIVQEGVEDSSEEEKVTILYGSGTKFGRLHKYRSSILLGGRRFVHSYDYTPDTGPELCYGDGSSWVLSTESKGVVGMVVAEIRSENIVLLLPLFDVMQNIQQTLRLHVVTLPTLRDIVKCEILNRERSENIERTECGSSDENYWIMLKNRMMKAVLRKTVK